MRIVIRNSIALFFVLALALGCGNQGSTSIPGQSGPGGPGSTGQYTNPNPDSTPSSTPASSTPPSSTPPAKAPPVYVWELLERLTFENKKFHSDVLAEDKVYVRNLEDKRTLIEKALNPESDQYYYLKHIVSAPSISAIKKEHLAPKQDDISLIFVKLAPKEWEDPIPGEVKFINDMRFQFIALDKNDSVAMILGSEKLNKDIKESISIKIPWDPASLTKIGSGGKGAVYRVTYAGRTFAIKHNDRGYTYVNKEIANYEALKGLDGFGPYLGFLGGKLDRGFMVGGDSSAAMMLGLGESSLKESLNGLTKPEVEALFKPILEIVGRLHGENMYHSDIKPANFLLVNGKPSLIDLDNVKTYRQEITRGSGYTHPYYELGDYFGIKADLKALGFSFYEMRYYGGRDGHGDKFKQHNGEWFFAHTVDAQVLINAIKADSTADNIDQVIKGLLQGSFNNAEEALAAF